MAAQFEIETGIEIPPRSHGLGSSAKYPFTEMEVGQSFFVQSPPKYFANIVTQAGRTRGRKFSYRKMDGGVRVWRVA